MWLVSFAEDNKSSRPAPETSDPGTDPPNAAGAELPEEEQPVSAGAEVNDALRLMLPWVTSVLFHLGIIVLTLFVVWSTMGPEEDKNIVPVAKLSENPGSELSQAQQTEPQNARSQREVRTEEVESEQSMDQQLEMESESEMELVGVSGGGGGGNPAPFGTTGQQNTELSAEMFGTGGNARKIAYLVDASGSLIDTLPFVIRELKRSINELSEKQQFTIFFFQAGEAIEVPPRRWKRATAEMKSEVADWISLEAGNIVPRGATTPIPAVKAVMRYNPELLFILSDNITGQGRYEVDQRKLLELLDKHNPDRQMKVNCIQFLYPDPLNTLKTIAEEHGGNYTFVKESDLGLQ